MNERYLHGYSGTGVDSHARRTAANSAAFLLPHVVPTHEVLDLGCGPGSITLDLAEHVAAIIGIDSAPEVIARADADRQRRRVGNASFTVANVYELPHTDASFDVVYAHQLLQHLAEPVRALREACRVLRPGGILAVRDADYGTMVHDPPEPALDRWLALYQEAARRSGGEPNAGRKLRRWVATAGFTDIVATSSTWTFSTPEAIAEWCGLWTSRLLQARLGKRAIELGVATGADLEDLAAGWERWAADPNAFFTFLHGEVLARRPG